MRKVGVAEFTDDKVRRAAKRGDEAYRVALRNELHDRALRDDEAEKVLEAGELVECAARK